MLLRSIGRLVGGKKRYERPTNSPVETLSLGILDRWRAAASIRGKIRPRRTAEGKESEREWLTESGSDVEWLSEDGSDVEWLSEDGDDDDDDEYRVKAQIPEDQSGPLLLNPPLYCS